MGAAGRMRQAIVAAFESGDREALLAAFALDARVVIGSTVLTGREAIASALADASSGLARAGLSFGPSSFQTCIDGAVEWGGSYTITYYRTASETLRGTYALRWTRADTTLRIHSLTFDRTGSAPRIRCELASSRRYQRARFAIGATLTSHIGGTHAGPSIAREMTRRQYPEGNAFGGPETPDIALSDHGSEPLLIGARVRPLGRIWIEGVLSVQDYRVQTRRRVGNGNWQAANRGRIHAAMAALDWRALRVGLGPALVRSSWGAGWAPDFEVPANDTSWVDSHVGFAYQVAAAYPATGSLLLEARFFGVSAAASVMPALGGAEPVRATNGARWLSAGLSLAF